MYHYKESPPDQTVSRIRCILESLEIKSHTESWISLEDRNYSLRLAINGTEIGTNGKGVTKELALASAYGEFMERIQNQYLYPLYLYYQYDTSMQKLHGFYHSPDEILLTIPEFLEKTDKEILSHLIPSDINENESLEKYLNAFSLFDPQPQKEKLLSIPYYHINTRSLVYLPLSIISYVYGTNGMCAGNTPEEALVQGLCEIMERYAYRMTILQDLTLPDIPMDRLDLRSYKLLEPLKNNEHFKIFVKDASVGEQLPVVSICIINFERSKYFVKFGSHVEFSIALERALTEMLQGKTIEELEKGKHMASFEYILDGYDKNQKNLMEIFVSGEGKYNNSFFGKFYSYPTNKDFYQARNLKNNSKYLQYLIKDLLNKGWEILVRDVNFLGFPSFHIIIPGVSEIRNLRKNNCIKLKREIGISKLLMDVNMCTKNELNTIFQYVEENRNNYVTLSDLIKITFRKDFFWRKIKLDLFLSMLCLKIQEFEKSYHYLKKYISEIEEKNIDIEMNGLKYYKCIRDYLFILIKKEKIRKKEVNILQCIYGDETFREVNKAVFNVEEALQHYGRFDCVNCSKCIFTQFCVYEKIQNIHKKIKNRIIENQIDQLFKNKDFWSEFV